MAASSTSNAIPLAIVGCGGMGIRHILGLKELEEAIGRLFDLVAVVDVIPERAHRLAALAEDLLGRRPVVATRLSALAASKSVAAVDVCSGTDTHLPVSLEALELGVHLLVEKPLAQDISSCASLIEASARAGSVLAVAENIRREPVNRFVKALLRAGVIGELRYVSDTVLTGRDSILLTPWRHQQASGGIMLDVAVHHADVIEYLAGPIASVFARVRLDESRRFRRDAPMASARFYVETSASDPNEVVADAEDVAVALLQFEDGAVGQMTVHYAAHGQSQGGRLLYGSTGSIALGLDRTGDQPSIVLDSGQITLEEALEAVPDYALDSMESRIWGGKRVPSFNAAFDVIDRKLVASELADFWRAVTQGAPPEVPGIDGMRSVTVISAFFESQRRGAEVPIAQVATEPVAMASTRDRP